MKLLLAEGSEIKLLIISQGLVNLFSTKMFQNFHFTTTTHQSTARRAALAGRSRAGVVQAVCNGPSMSTEQGTTVHERLLRPYLVSK